MLCAMSTPDVQRARDAIEQARESLDEAEAALVVPTTPPPIDTPEPEPIPEPAPQPTPQPAVLPAPAGHVVRISGRKAISAWQPVDGAAEYEVHEFLADPAHTLKAVTTATTRTSGNLTSTHYQYGVRARARAGDATSVGQWAIPVDVYIGATPTPVTPTPTPTPTTPTATEPAVPASGRKPADVLDLRNWTIMLPTGTVGDPDNNYAAKIGSIVNVFYVGDDGAVVFEAPADAVHSPHSKFGRTEAREMADASWTLAAWPSSGDNELECDLAIDTSGLVTRKRINGMQIHDGADDVCQIMRHETQGLGLMHSDGKAWESIDPGYTGGRVTVRIQAKADRLVVFYQGRQVVDIPKKGTGWFWKFGCYLQTDVPTYGEAPDRRGRVRVWRYVQRRDGKVVNGAA